MKKVKEIIRLNEEAGMSLRQIANALNISRPAVTNILTKWKELNYTFQEIKDLPDSKLEEKIFCDRKSTPKADQLKEKFPYYAKELKKKGPLCQDSFRHQEGKTI